jgi:hypothetical protein
MSNSYPVRGVAAPLNHAVYSKYLSLLGRNGPDENHLKSRGLDMAAIMRAGYATKPNNVSVKSQEVLAKILTEFNLDGVPGFFIDDKGHRNQSGIYGIMIPVRDFDGHINQILVRNQNPKKKDGKT